MLERTLILIKPDAIQRGLIGKIIERFERKGLKIIGMKMFSLDHAIVLEHYAHLKDKPFFESLSHFMRSSPIIALCLEGVEVINAVRLISGITKSREAEPGSIRGDFAMSMSCNVVHASDSQKMAEEEIKRFFKPNELFEYAKSEYEHVYAEDEK